MPRSLLLTGPLPIGGGSLLAHLRVLVTADVLVRRARAEGGVLPWVGGTVAGGLAGQRAIEDDLLREGLDRAVLGRAAFVARAGDVAAAGRRELAVLADALGLEFDADAAVAAGDSAAAAARTAFVRLFDAGLVIEADRVVGTCPRCATTVAANEAVPVNVKCEALTLRLTLLDGSDEAGHLEVRCLTPELLPGVVAVAVPEGSQAAATSALVPVTASVVPVVVDALLAEPAFVVPAHDQAAHDLARRLGLAPVPVIDAEGMVCAPGPLAGLARYAARDAARRLLEAEQAVVGAVEAAELAERCPACRSVLVPLLRRQWFLALSDLETAAADAVRDGRLAVWPAAGREDLLAVSGAGEWCLTQQVWGGVPVPVARCLDCATEAVSVDPGASCGKCMGDLVPADDVLDARFVRCLWPLAATGWPGATWAPSNGADEGAALLLVPAEAAGEILPMVALGLRLTGAVPFDEVAVLAPTETPPDGEPELAPADLPPLATELGSPAVRVALLCGGFELVGARELVRRLADPPVGGVDVDQLADAVAGAFAAAAPSSALGMLAAAVGEGVPAADADRVRDLAGPFLGA